MNLLQGCGNAYLARREIARKALNRQIFEDNPHWADATLSGLVDRQVLEQNESGHYRIKRPEV